MHQLLYFWLVGFWKGLVLPVGEGVFSVFKVRDFLQPYLDAGVFSEGIAWLLSAEPDKVSRVNSAITVVGSRMSTTGLLCTYQLSFTAVAARDINPLLL